MKPNNINDKFSAVSLCTTISKCLFYHLYMVSFIDTNIPTAQTFYPVFFLFYLVSFRNPVLMTP